MTFQFFISYFLFLCYIFRKAFQYIVWRLATKVIYTTVEWTAWKFWFYKWKYLFCIRRGLKITSVALSLSLSVCLSVCLSLSLSLSLSLAHARFKINCILTRYQKVTEKNPEMPCNCSRLTWQVRHPSSPKSPETAGFSGKQGTNKNSTTRRRKVRWRAEVNLVRFILHIRCSNSALTTQRAFLWPHNTAICSPC